MRACERGFTAMELLIVVIVVLVLASMAVSAAAPARQALAVRNARQTLAAMHARTRAHAVETGELTVLAVDMAADRAVISRGGETLESMDFGLEMDVDLQASSSFMTACMNARGFGETSCNSFDTPAEIRFVLRDESRSMRIFPLGQVILP